MKVIAAVVFAAVIVAAVGFASTLSTSTLAPITSFEAQHGLAHSGNLPVSEIDDQTFVFNATQPAAEPNVASKVGSATRR